MSAPLEFVPNPGSFRDPQAKVFQCGARIMRALSDQSHFDWQELKQKKFFPRAIRDGRIVNTWEWDGNPPGLSGNWACFLEHHPVPFISYPFEWCFSMLKDAAILHLELLSEALAEGMILKDATPYNVQWVGPHPIFIDTASFSKHSPSEPWQAYGQFCRLFLYPLMLQCHRGVPFQPLLRSALEGISPRLQWHLLGFSRLLHAGVFKHVFLFSKLQNALTRPTKVRSQLRESGFSVELVKHNVQSLLRLVRNLKPAKAESSWSSYEAQCPYEQEARSYKESVVGAIVSQRRRRLVWDMGCNTGFFSRLAASNSDYVIALDFDAECIEKLYLELRQEQLSILPLVWDVMNPSPALGFANRERKELTDRGTPDLVLALALVHHLAISASIPLVELVAWFASFSPEMVIEWVGPEDPMARILLEQKNVHYRDYNIASFVQVVEKFFRIIKRHPLSGESRELFHVERLPS